mgnify:CR=1 FL=1
MKTREFIYGKYQYKYTLVKENRKTMSLIVEPDMTIVLKCPLNASNQKIESFLKRKWFWLEKQLSFFKKYQRKIYKKEYISGESFLYLGRQYTLLVKRGKNEGIVYYKGKIILTTNHGVRNSKYNKKMVERWYKNRITIKFQESYHRVIKNFDYDFTPELVVRKLNKRWGSFLYGKKIILNPELIKAPTDCLDYVITHELCHMMYKNHNKDFYKLLSKKCTNWKSLKEKLELRLG